MRFIIAQKDLNALLHNKRHLIMLILMPLLMTVALPACILVTIHSLCSGDGITAIVSFLPDMLQGDNPEWEMVNLMVQSVFPSIFMMMPIMSASVVGANSIAGERERRTLMTLMFSPYSLKHIFIQKVMASFLVGMFVSLVSFVAMILTIEPIIYTYFGGFFIPGVNWFLTIFLVSPVLCLVAITLIVNDSTKAKSVEEAQQSATVLFLPIALIVSASVSNAMMANALAVLAIGGVCLLFEAFLIYRVGKKMDPEKLIS